MTACGGLFWTDQNWLVALGRRNNNNMAYGAGRHGPRPPAKDVSDAGP